MCALPIVADARFLHLAGCTGRLCHRGGIDRDDLCSWRFPARAGVHLYVSLGAHPDRDDGRKIASRDLQELARRAARQRQEGREESRRLRRLRRLQTVRRGLPDRHRHPRRSEEHTSELQSLMRIAYAVFCVNKNKLIQSTKYIEYPQQISYY